MVDTVPDMPRLTLLNAEGIENSDDGHISFEGLPNTRDLGGIRAADGRFVKHAHLLRSGALYRATDRDVKILRDNYNVKTIVDLRTEEERREKPDPQDAFMDVRLVEAPVLGASTLGITREGGLLDMLKMFRAVQRNPVKVMMDIYPRMLMEEEGQRGYAAFFKALLEDDDGSVLWHCTVGKDRAGLATALVLHVLGASREDILADYEVTNRYVASRTDELRESLAAYHLPGNIDGIIDIVNSADARFLSAALEAAEERYGSLDAYVEQALGVRWEDQQALRTRYLTDDPQG